MSLPIEQQIDYHFIRTPYEVICKYFKQSRKQLEHELILVLSQISHINSENKAQKLIDKLKEIKEKLNVGNQQYLSYCNQLLFRLQQGECSHGIRLQRELIDNLLREGYVSTAEKLIQNYQIDNFTMIEQELILESNKIIKDLKSKSVRLALKWCKQNDSSLKKHQSTLENNLIYKQYIDLLVQNQVEAIEYLRQHNHQVQQETTYKAVRCLLFNKNLDQFPQQKKYFDECQWEELIKQFKQDLYKIYCFPIESPFISAIKCGISTLKTQYCNQQGYQQPHKCPICNQKIQELSNELATTQKLGSTWICRISGEYMDENNYPMVLPNNQIYCQNALKEMSEQKNGIIICPITKQKFKYEECVRVYLT